MHNVFGVLVQRKMNGPLIVYMCVSVCCAGRRVWLYDHTLLQLLLLVSTP